ncbi:MAG: phage tail protein [Salibacteraceae bacterium]
MPEYYPPLGFHFRVEFDLFGIGEESTDARFKEVSGLNAALGSETYDEGGENRFSHRFPNRASYGNLVLRRGMLPSSEIVTWCRKAIENFDFETSNVSVILLNNEHEPLASWEFVNAWPTSWSVDSFNAEDGKIVVESLELSYNYFRRTQ